MRKWKVSFGTLMMITFINLLVSLAPHTSEVRASGFCRNSPRNCSNVVCQASCSGTCQCTGNTTTQTCSCNCTDGSASTNFCTW